MDRMVIAKTLVFILFAIALAPLVFGENITYIYTTSDGSVIASNASIVPSQVNVTLPNTTWNLDMLNNDSRFRVSVSGLNVTDYPSLTIYARVVNLSSQTYSGVLGIDTNTYRYTPKYAYAFNVSEFSSKSYTVTMNYTGLSVPTPLLFKCDFNFTTNITNTSNCTQLSATVNSASSTLAASATGFSSFFIADDSCASRCGGPCTACAPGDSGPGGGGGGGGGGGSRSKLIYVTPTPEGASVQVYQGDELVIQLNGKEYHFKVDQVVSMKVKLKSLSSYLTYEFNFGETKSLGLESFFSKDVDVSMHVSNNFAMLTFTSREKPKLSFPLLSPKPRTQSPQQQVPEFDAAAYSPRPTQQATGQAASPAVSAPELQVPESPINLWTIIFSVVFVIFLVGGVALYRARLHYLEKPPTVTRTGLESTGLPEISSTGSKPAFNLEAVASVLPEAKKEEKVEIKAVEKEERIVIELPREQPVVQPRKEYHLAEAKKLELEKYIFHAFSAGFGVEQVRKALLDKGWPQELVEQVLSEINEKK